MFVLYREGYEIYGVGETPEEAKRDALEWLDGGIEEAEKAEIGQHDIPVVGKLYIGECTDRLAAALRDDKEELVFDLNEVGLLDVIDGENVEE
jgi:hypothetical protein